MIFEAVSLTGLYTETAPPGLKEAGAVVFSPWNQQGVGLEAREAARAQRSRRWGREFGEDPWSRSRGGSGGAPKCA